MDTFKNQQAAINYVKAHKVDFLIKEMLNTAIQETNSSNQPHTNNLVVFNMIKYLTQFTDKKTLEKEGIKLNFLENENSTENKEKKLDDYKYNPVLKEFYFPDNSSLIIKKFLTPKEYEKLKSVKTVFGGHISHLIDVALKLDNRETVGIYTTDFDCYDKMSCVISPAMEFLHSFDKEKSLFSYYNPNSEFYEECKEPNLNEFKYKNNDIIKSIRIKLARNLRGFPYLPHALEHTRKAIKEKIVNYLKEHFTKGGLIEADNKDFSELKNIYFDKEINLISAGCKCYKI